jgi:hypothetical protein
MHITSNMAVTPDPSNSKRWFLTTTFSGETMLHLNIQNTKGSEHHWTYSTEVKENGNWYSKSQKDLDWIQTSASFYRQLELPSTADDFRLIIEMFIEPAADITAAGDIDIRAQLS